MENTEPIITEKRKLSDLQSWEKNPRDIKPEDLERLKTQITELGQYKPLVITPDGIILGGNMRYQAFKDLGIEEVWVVVVQAPDDSTKLKYALSDNDRAGYYKTEQLANLIKGVQDYDQKFDPNLFKIDMGYQTYLQDVLDKFVRIESAGAAIVDDGRAKSDKGAGQADNYTGSSIKQIVLYFGLEDYEKALNDLEIVAKKYELEDNTAIILQLIKFWKENH